MIKAKILLDLPTDIIESKRLVEQWENEGGSASTNIIDDITLNSQLPFSPGDSFTVVSGYIEEVNNQFYYCVSLKKIEAKIYQ